MANVEPDEVRLQPVVSREVVERLDQLGTLMGWSRNQTVEWILENATSDIDWWMNRAMLRVSAGIKRIIGKGKSEGGAK